MIELVPKWIMYDEFWRTLKRRNLWLIYLRYAVVSMLLGLVLLGEIIPSIALETFPIGILTVAVLLYNLVFHRSHPALSEGYAPFNGLHFALLQMSCDFLALLALIYLTGGVESPFYYFFIFHVIIGSLILPRHVVSLLILFTMLVIGTGAFLEINGSIPHFAVDGYFAVPQFNSTLYVITHVTILALILFISNYLANSISKELYLRERSLTIAYRKLEEAEKAKSRYVMSVVHDLKTPIAAAMTYLNMILDGSLGRVPDAFERPLERSRIRLNNAIAIVNDILQLTQLKLAEKPVISQVNLTELIDEIYQEMRILFVAKKIRFSTWINSEKDIYIEGERQLLKLALSNLISNTHKYTERDGRVEIHIQEKNDEVTIEIADNGIGIPADEQKKIFQDFYRSSVSKQKGIEGTGLGMSVVLHIIRQFHGRIEVQSPSQLADGPERQGTEFLIMLPVHYQPPVTDVEEVDV
ncbi:MAG: HAMP domain-containing histidine kinase [Bacteroidetes bacterium]|nr:HAMP domain-containing histidine kinase [Bacteroidota bacterium]